MPAKGNLSNPQNPHISEENFRRFEDWFVKLLAVYPEPLVVTPEGMAVQTFSTAIRSAANAFLLNSYPSTVPLEDFRLVWKDTVVSVVGPTVVIRKRSVKLTEALGENNAPASYLFELTSPSVEQLNAIAQLYTTGVSQLPTRIAGSLPPQFTPPFGVVLHPQTSDSWLMF